MICAGNAAAAADSNGAEAESKASAEAKAAAEATDPPKPVTKKKRKKKKKVATGEVSDRSLRTLDSGAPMMRQQGDVIVDDLDKEVGDEDEEYEFKDDEIEEEEEEEVFELEMTGVAENDEAANADQSQAGPKQQAPPLHTTAPPVVQSSERSADSAAKQASSGPAGESLQNASLASAAAAAQPSPQLAAAAPAAAGEAVSGAAAGPPAAATGPPGVAAGAPAQPAAKPARPWFPLPEKREISTEVLSSLINASAAAVKRDAAAFGSKLRKHAGLPDTAAEDSTSHRHHGETVEEGEVHCQPLDNIDMLYVCMFLVSQSLAAYRSGRLHSHFFHQPCQ